MTKLNPNVDFYFTKAKQWKEEYEALRILVSDCGLTEELKWGVPCYTYNRNNVVLIHGFKNYCALLFHKGVLLKDTAGILTQQTENVQAARQLRFSGIEDIVKKSKLIKAYVKEAIQVEKSGAKVEFKPTAAFNMPDEFKEVLENSEALKRAFYALSPGRQRGYLLYFSQAKQAKTRSMRVEKYLPAILQGKGLED
jgi:uncharacterized protein YdeI (YjbR/CyaY-like superfamily)